MPAAAPRATFAVTFDPGAIDLTPLGAPLPLDPGMGLMRAIVTAGRPYLGAHERLVPFALDLSADGVLGSGDDAEMVQNVAVEVLDYDPRAGTYTDVTARLLQGVPGTTAQGVTWTLGDANAAAGHTYLCNVDVRTTTFRTLQVLCGPVLCPALSGYAAQLLVDA